MGIVPFIRPIPLVSLTLHAACTPAADPVDAETTSGSGDATQGVSETGAPPGTTATSTSTSTAPTTTAPTSGGDTSTTEVMPDASTSTTGDDPDTSTGESCPNTGGDPPDPDIKQCTAGSCDPGSVCLQTLSCDLVAAPCDGQCIRQTHPTHCEPIPMECQGRPDKLEACLEQEFLLCTYGGDYQDGLLACDYVFDQCGEGDGYDYYPSC